MRKFGVVFVFFFVFSAFALAQVELKPFVVPKTEVFVGFAHEYSSMNGSYAGTEGNVMGNSTGQNGIAFEFGHYLRDSNFGFMSNMAHVVNNRVDPTGIKYTRTSYMAGPTYRLKNYGFFLPSVHVLAGVDHGVFTVPESLPSNFTFTSNEFAAAMGATVDGTLSRHLAVRLAQLDYVYSHHYSTSQSSFRYSGGLVVRF